MTWKFALPSGLRLDRLLSAPSFEVITHRVIEALARKDAIVCKHEQRCDTDVRFYRAVYCANVQAPVFDLFLNAATGYRGKYFESPERGLGANATFIEALRPVLLQSGALCDSPHIDPRVSLEAGSAKTWLAEQSKRLCEACGEWSTPDNDSPEILNERWEKVDYEYAKYGRKAPFLTKLRVIGAFVNSSGDEFIPPDKRKRAQHIYDWGWS